MNKTVLSFMAKILIGYGIKISAGPEHILIFSMNAMVYPVNRMILLHVSQMLCKFPGAGCAMYQMFLKDLFCFPGNSS
jgi:hypothetical protein